jgi:iron complex transport system substrate-binding protein
MENRPLHDTVRRVVCLTEETTETLYRLGLEDRIAGISAFTVRPARAREEKPVVSQFTKAEVGRILDLEPDLVLAFSDLQAEIVAELLRHGIEVHGFNHRSVEGILSMVRRVGALVGVPAEADRLADELAAYVATVEAAAARFPRRPRVYFEEWHDPIITGIRWVSEVIELAGGEDVYPEHRGASLARDRIVADPRQVPARSPELYLASWCGRKFRPDYLPRRPGWAGAPFLGPGRVHEIDSALILQPGPAALTDGLHAVHRILAGYVGAEPAPPPPPFA